MKIASLSCTTVLLIWPQNSPLEHIALARSVLLACRHHFSIHIILTHSIDEDQQYFIGSLNWFIEMIALSNISWYRLYWFIVLIVLINISWYRLYRFIVWMKSSKIYLNRLYRFIVWMEPTKHFSKLIT